MCVSESEQIGCRKTRKIDYIMQQAGKNNIKTEIHRRLREQPGAMELVHFLGGTPH